MCRGMLTSSLAHVQRVIQKGHTASDATSALRGSTASGCRRRRGMGTWGMTPGSGERGESDDDDGDDEAEGDGEDAGEAVSAPAAAADVAPVPVATAAAVCASAAAAACMVSP